MSILITKINVTWLVGLLPNIVCCNKTTLNIEYWNVSCQLNWRLVSCLTVPHHVAFNQLLSVAMVPDEWNTAVNGHIFRKGEAGSISNCWPVSLTCKPSKILERTITKNILQYLADQNIQHPAQHGFVVNYLIRSMIGPCVHSRTAMYHCLYWLYHCTGQQCTIVCIYCTMAQDSTVPLFVLIVSLYSTAQQLFVLLFKKAFDNVSQ